MKTVTKAVLIVLVVAGLGYVLSQNTSLLQQANVASGGIQPSTNYGNSGPATQAPVQTYAGDLIIKNVISDGANPSTSRTDGTNVKIQYYIKNSDGSYTMPTTSASNTATVNITPTTKQLWMSTQIPSGQAFYVATDKMLNAHPRMGVPTWADANLDNLLEPTFPIDVTNVGSLNKDTQTPSFTLPIYLYTQGNPTMNSGSYITGSNHTAVGAGTVQNIEKFTLDFGANAQAVALGEIKLVMNDTATTDWNKPQSYCTAPNVPNIPLSSFQETVGASTTTYKYDFGGAVTVSTADLIVVPKVGDTSIPMYCYIYSSLPSTNSGFTITPTLTWVDMQGATHAVVGHIIKIVA